MKYFFLSIMLFFGAILQSSLFTWPFLLGILILYTIWTKDQWVYVLAFIFGLVNDLLSFHVLGISSIYFIGCVGIIFLYQRKYEISSPIFVIVSTFAFSFIYEVLFVQNASFASAGVLSLLALGVFFISLLFTPHKSLGW